ncbi:leukocyte immunoglobulin-like receptor subfamily A member 6 [Marmota flaviventris]|uniref:leukocyte immunoglobulin-like receptor subfamily A member 6 n=1 Tax=Marmota flaviventris TaxID=93162 RepID=UPI003A88E671
MASTLTTLFYLGLSLSPGIQAQHGSLPKPSIWAVPGPVVPQGSPVSIFCRGPPGAARQRLQQVGGSRVWAAESPGDAQAEAAFSLQRATPSHSGTYVCQYKTQDSWSERSDPLELLVVGVSKDKPTLSVQPGPMVALGGSVTLHCHLPSAYDVFLLSKGAELALPAGSIQGGQGKFLLSPATRAHGGTYRCYGSVNTSLHGWSAPSNLLELMVTGIYKKPQLLAVQGPSGAPQHMTTLQCRSEMWFDLFLLSQEGSANATQRLRSQYKRGFFQANFTLDASEQARGATYRCYGSLSSFPSLWSDPSEPLRLSGRGSAAWNSFKVNMLRLSLAGVTLLILLGFLVEAWLSRRDPRGAVERPPALPDGDRVLWAPGPGRLQPWVCPMRLLSGQLGVRGPGPGSAMATGVSVLLGLGPPIAVLFLEQRTQAQEGVPSIWAEPGSLVPHGSAVTIVCRIPPGVTQLRLYHVETKLWRDRDPQGAPEVAQFSLQQVTHNQTGTYHCEYWTEGLPSGHSDPLELVVTGMYKEKPSLTAEPGPQVASGGQVALLCHTTYSYDVFTLCRDRAASLSQKCSHQTHSSFLMSPVTLAHGGTYRCYFSSRNRPHLWSLPSDPLDLLVTGPPSPLVVGVSAAAAVLLGLCLLLLGLCLCRHRGHRRARRRVTDGGTKSPVWDVSSSPASDVQREDEDDTEHRGHGQLDTQAPAAEGPQEVTYVQLHPRTLTRSVGALLSRAPQDGSAQPCVYATLTLP